MFYAHRFDLADFRGVGSQRLAVRQYIPNIRERRHEREGEPTQPTGPGDGPESPGNGDHVDADVTGAFDTDIQRIVFTKH